MIRRGTVSGEPLDLVQAAVTYYGGAYPPMDRPWIDLKSMEATPMQHAPLDAGQAAVQAG